MSDGSRTSASERLIDRMSILPRHASNAGPRAAQLARSRIGGDQRPRGLRLADDRRKAFGRLVRQRRHVDEIGGEGLGLEILRLQQRIGAAEREYRRVAVMRRHHDRGPGRRAAVAHRPARRDALRQQPGEHGIGARVLSELHQRAHIEPEPGHADGGIHGAAAGVGRDLGGLGLAALPEQQERGIRVQHAHALDAVAGDDRDRIDGGGADGETFHEGSLCPVNRLVVYAGRTQQCR
jgi:hypothetical protein